MGVSHSITSEAPEATEMGEHLRKRRDFGTLQRN